MKIAIFCHSILSDWNHGNAHFLRGIATELAARGHAVSTFEELDAWSVTNLLADYGPGALIETREHYPLLASKRYELESLDLDEALDGADVVLVHEWNPHELVRRIGRHRAKGGRYLLFFHDTHHRAVSAPEEMARYDLSAYDGVLAFGEVLRAIYEKNGWGRRAFVWHEAADTRKFRPKPEVEPSRDLVWIGNWGDEERTRELDELLLEPVHELRLDARIYGVRYPKHARERLGRAGVEYAGWLPNYKVPDAYARYRVTVHVPRRPYVEQLPGIPTIRPFEALACAIPLVSAPWRDVEGLFSPGEDFLVASTGAEMKRHLYALVHDRDMALEIARRGRRTVAARHTCAHRVDELLGICAALGARREAPAA
jgi:spore maturation protein CgeB